MNLSYQFSLKCLLLMIYSRAFEKTPLNINSFTITICIICMYMTVISVETLVSGLLCFMAYVTILQFFNIPNVFFCVPQECLFRSSFYMMEWSLVLVAEGYSRAQRKRLNDGRVELRVRVSVCTAEKWAFNAGFYLCMGHSVRCHSKFWLVEEWEPTRAGIQF